MNNIKRLGIFLLLLALILSVGFLLWKQVRKTPSPLVSERKPTPTSSILAPIGLIVDVRLDQETPSSSDTLKLVVSPEKETVNLSAFALRITVEGEGLQAKGVLKPNLNLGGQKWSFPIAKVSSGQDDSLILELSGAYIAQFPFVLEKEEILATLTIEPITPKVSLSTSIDEEVTRFRTNDPDIIIPVTTKR